MLDDASASRRRRAISDKSSRKSCLCLDVRSCSTELILRLPALLPALGRTIPPTEARRLLTANRHPLHSCRWSAPNAPICFYRFRIRPQLGQRMPVLDDGETNATGRSSKPQPMHRSVEIVTFVRILTGMRILRADLISFSLLFPLRLFGKAHCPRQSLKQAPNVRHAILLKQPVRHGHSSFGIWPYSSPSVVIVLYSVQNPLSLSTMVYAYTGGKRD